MITISGAPQPFQPVFNPLYYFVDSTNKSEIGFQYILDLYSAGTQSRISRQMTFPAPVSGYGEFGINQILQSSVSFDLNQSSTGSTRNNDAIVNYEAVFGEQYLFQWTYEDYLHAGTIYTASTYPNNYLLSGLTSHIFNVGDLIQVNAASGSPSTLTGVHTVVEVPSQYYIVLGTNFVAGPTLSGTVYYADERLTQYTGLTSGATRVAYNGVMGHKDFKDYDSNDYVLNSGTTGQFLTNMPNDYTVRSDASGWLSAYFSGAVETNYAIHIVTDDGNEVRIQAPLAQTTVPAQQLAVFPHQLNQSTLIFGSQPVIGPTTTAYSAWTEDLSSSARTSEIKTFTVSDKCTKFGVFELLFMDKMGSWISKSFEYNNTRNVNITRSEYQKFIGELSDGKFAYNSIDRGRTNLNTYSITELTLNTGWLTEDDADFLANNLYASPEVYMKIHGDDIEFWPVIITSNATEVPKYYNKRNIQFPVTLQYAFYDASQNF